MAVTVTVAVLAMSAVRVTVAMASSTIAMAVTVFTSTTTHVKVRERDGKKRMVKTLDLRERMDLTFPNSVIINKKKMTVAYNDYNLQL